MRPAFADASGVPSATNANCLIFLVSQDGRKSALRVFAARLRDSTLAEARGEPTPFFGPPGSQIETRPFGSRWKDSRDVIVAQ